MKENKICTLPNGLKIVLYKDSTKSSCYAELIVKYGAINNEFILNNEKYSLSDGIAHLLEHVLIEHSIFGNSRNYFHDNYVKSNGETSFKTTNYYIKTVHDFFSYLEKLIKIVNIPNFNRSDIETSKSAIYEEIGSLLDKNYYYLSKLEKECLFENIRINSILGSVDEVKNITYDTLKMCYDIFYQPQNQILVVSGNIDIEEVVKFVTKVYDEIKKEHLEYKIPELKEKNEVVKSDGEIYRDTGDDYVRIDYKINISSFKPYDRVKLTFYLNYFLSYNFNETSDTYKKLIEDKISIYNIEYNYDFMGDFLIISISSHVLNISKFVDLVINVMKNKNINEEYFNIQKKREIINLILREENYIKMTDSFIDNILTFNYYDIDKLDDIMSQTYDDYKKTIELLNFDNYCVLKMLMKGSLS